MYYSKKLLYRLNKKDGEWPMEINEIVWKKNGPIKLDIRSWQSDYQKMTKGPALTDEEAFVVLRVFMKSLIDRDVFKDDAAESVAALIPKLDKLIGDAGMEVPNDNC